MKKVLSLTLAIIMIVCTIPTYSIANIKNESDEVITLPPARLCEDYFRYLVTNPKINSCEVASGKLPDGLNMAAEKGDWILMGTPEKMGEFYFEIKYFIKGESEYELYKYRLTVNDVFIPELEDCAIYEDFENGTEGWQMPQYGNDNKGWKVVSDKDMAYEGKGFASSKSGASGNWLISPVVSINKDAILTWYSKAQDTTKTEYGIYICYDDMDADVSTYIRLWDYTATSEWKPNAYSIKGRKREQARIAFFHYNQYGSPTLNIDFITLTKGNEYDRVVNLEAVTAGFEYKDKLIEANSWSINNYELKGELPEGLKITSHISGYDIIFELSGTPTKPGGYDFLIYYFFDDEWVITIKYAIYVKILGDINSDGVVNTGDASRILLGIVNPEIRPVLSWRFADINMDGVVNTGDAVAILKIIVG